MKILMLGDSGVGKSTFIQKLQSDSSNMHSIPTWGLEFYTYEVELYQNIHKISFISTSGSSKFREINSAYMEGCSGFILVFDMYDKKTFENLKIWKESVGFNNLIIGTYNKNGKNNKSKSKVNESEVLEEFPEFEYYQLDIDNDSKLLFNPFTKKNHSIYSIVNKFCQKLIREHTNSCHVMELKQLHKCFC